MFRTVLKRSLNCQVRQFSNNVVLKSATNASKANVNQVVRHLPEKPVFGFIADRLSSVVGWAATITVVMGWPLGFEWAIKVMGGINNLYSIWY